MAGRSRSEPIMTDVEVREVRTDEFPAWDDLAARSPHGTVFSRSDWITTCASLSQRTPLLIGYFEDGRLAGGCSLYVTRNGFQTYCRSTAPTTPYGGYVLQENGGTKVRDREARARAIVQAIADEIAGRTFTQVRIVNAPTFRDLRPLTWNDWTGQVYYTYSLPLVEGIEATFSKKTRNTIRKAEKSEVRVRKTFDPRVFRDLNLDTYRRQGREPPFSEAFLAGMLDLIVEKNLGEMWIAETSSGEPASAEVVVWDDRTAHRWLAASDAAHRGTGATSLLVSEVVQDLWRRGFGEINLMAGNNPQLSRFVAGFNPELVPYYGAERTGFLSDIARSFRREWKRVGARRLR